MQSESDERGDLLAAIASGGNSRIVRRQTTNWDVEVNSRGEVALYRIHFHRKREACFVEAAFRNLAISDSHPVLAQYGEAWARVFVAAPARDADGTISALDGEIRALSEGWRSLADYSNPSASVADILSSGQGLVIALL